MENITVSSKIIHIINKLLVGGSLLEWGSQNQNDGVI